MSMDSIAKRHWFVPSAPCNMRSCGPWPFHSIAWYPSEHVRMIVVLICLLTVFVVALAERSPKYLAFAIAEQCFLASALALVVGDFNRAVLLSCLVTSAIAGASAVKYDHSGLKLTVTDLPLLA